MTQKAKVFVQSTNYSVYVPTCSEHKWGRRHSFGILSLVRSYLGWSRMTKERRDQASRCNGTELSSGSPAGKQKL